MSRALAIFKMIYTHCCKIRFNVLQRTGIRRVAD